MHSQGYYLNNTAILYLTTMFSALAFVHFMASPLSTMNKTKYYTLYAGLW